MFLPVLKSVKWTKRLTVLLTLLIAKVCQIRMSLVALNIFIVRYIQNIIKIVLKSLIKDFNTILTIVSILFFKTWKKRCFKYYVEIFSNFIKYIQRLCEKTKLWTIINYFSTNIQIWEKGKFPFILIVNIIYRS